MFTFYFLLQVSNYTIKDVLSLVKSVNCDFLKQATTCLNKILWKSVTKKRVQIFFLRILLGISPSFHCSFFTLEKLGIISSSENQRIAGIGMLVFNFICISCLVLYFVGNEAPIIYYLPTICCRCWDFATRFPLRACRTVSQEQKITSSNTDLLWV